jgi:hypothetical protein
MITDPSGVPASGGCITVCIVFSGLHSELTTQGQVTPKKIKKENKA